MLMRARQFFFFFSVSFLARTVERGFVRGAAYICPRAIIDLKAIPRLLRPPFVSPRPVAPLAALSSPLPFPRSLGARRFIRIVAISEALFQKECPHA